MDEAKSELRMDDLEQVAGGYGIDSPYVKEIENQIAQYEELIASGNLSRGEVRQLRNAISVMREKLPR